MLLGLRGEPPELEVELVLMRESRQRLPIQASCEARCGGVHDADTKGLRILRCASPRLAPLSRGAGHNHCRTRRLLPLGVAAVLTENQQRADRSD